MGDRAALQVQIYSCPPELVDEVLDLLEEYGLDGGDRAPLVLGPSRQAHLELGACYSRMEIPVESSDELASALPTAAAWKVWEDPAYEHLGQVHLHHPDLGRFTADCDPYGQPVFTSGQIDDLMVKVDGDRILMRHHTGVTWELAHEHLSLVNNGIVLPRMSAPLRAVALNQLASGPGRWMPPDAPGQARPPAGPER